LQEVEVTQPGDEPQGIRCSDGGKVSHRGDHGV